MKRVLLLLTFVSLTLLYGVSVINPGLTEEEIIYEADVIVYGRIVSKEAYWETKHAISTAYGVDVIDLIYTSATSEFEVGKVFEFSISGGEIGDEGMYVGGLRQFNVEDEILFFLCNENYNAVAPMVGIHQGYTIMNSYSEAMKVELISRVRNKLDYVKANSNYDWRINRNYTSNSLPTLPRPPLVEFDDAEVDYLDNSGIELQAQPGFSQSIEMATIIDAYQQEDRRRNSFEARESFPGFDDHKVTIPDTRWVFFASPPNLSLVWNIPPVLSENGQPWGNAFKNALIYWNRYVNNIHKERATSNNSIGRRNGSNEMAFVNEAQHQSIWGKSWGSARAKCWVYYTIPTNKIREADVIFKAELDWSVNFNDCYNPPNYNNYPAVALHELGHAIGIDHPWGNTGDHGKVSFAPHANSVMSYTGGSFLSALNNTLHTMDSWAARAAYPSRAKEISDFGVQFFHTTNGGESTAFATHDRNVRAGESFAYEGIFLENVGTKTETRTLEAYLSTHRHTFVGATQYLIDRLTLTDWPKNSYMKTSEREMYVPRNIPPGEYYILFDIGADDVNDNRYAWSHHKITVALPGGVPAVPGWIVVSDIGQTWIKVSWLDRSDNELGFQIWRRSETGNWGLAGTVGANETYFTVENLLPDTRYYIKVRAYNTDGASDFTDETSIKTHLGPPKAPSYLELTALSTSQIRLSWTDNSNDETGFTVHRKIGNDGEWLHLWNIPANTTELTNDNLQAGTIYYYRVRSYSNRGFSDWSETVGQTTFFPDPPTNLVATPITPWSIILQWEDNSTNETGFNLQVKESEPEEWSNLASTGANTTQYSHGGLQPSRTYYYRIRAYSANGYTQWSNTAAGTTRMLSPTNPNSVAAVALSTTQIRVTWNDASYNEAGFRVYRRIGDEGVFERIAELPANTEQYDDSGLTAGVTYYYYVTAYNDGGESPYTSIESATTQSLPNAPSGMTATAVSTSQINLSWTDNSDDETAFQVEQRIGATGQWTLRLQLEPNRTSAELYGLIPSLTYYYRVRARRDDAYSQWSNIADATTYDAPPNAPSNLIANAVSPTQINLMWIDNSENELGFRVEYKVGEGNWTWLTNHPANTFTLQHFNRLPDTVYYYRVAAFNNGGHSAYSNEAQAYTGEFPPATPSHIETSGVSTNQIDVSWRDNSDNEDGFIVERKDGADGEWHQAAQMPRNNNAFQNTGLSDGVTYFYRVYAFNAHGNSDYTATVSATTFQIVPSTPNNVSGYAAGTDEIQVTWIDTSNSELGFKVERSVGNESNYFQVAIVPANSTGYYDIGLTPTTLYYYRVRAYNDNGNSAYSNRVMIRTLGPPQAPSNLTANPVSSSEVTLTWSDNSHNEESFVIQRRQGSSEWYNIAEITPNTVTYNDTGLPYHHLFHYRVYAANTYGISSYSNQADAITPGPPEAPTNIAVTDVTKDYVTISWEDNAADEAGFILQRRTGGYWFVIAILGPDVTQFTDNDVLYNSLYYYRVSSFNVHGTSEYTEEIGALTPEPIHPPTSLYLSAVSCNEVSVQWGDMSYNETGFRLERRVSFEGEWELLVNTEADIEYYLDEDVEQSTVYFYRVRSFNDDEYSTWSNAARVETAGPPTAPSDLITDYISFNVINLLWVANCNNEEGFRLQRKIGDEGEWIFIDEEVPFGMTNFTDDNVAMDSQYHYRVCAYNYCGYSEWSDVLIVNTPEYPLRTPVGLSAATVSAEEINLDWVDNSSIEDGFRVERKGGLSAEWVEIAVTEQNSSYYFDLDVQPNMTYYYRVRAYNVDDISAYSNIAEAATTILPFSELFTVDDGWTVVNGEEVNRWSIGEATSYSGIRSAYISDNEGLDNRYDVNSASIVHIYRDIFFPYEALRFELSFRWKGMGEENQDYLRAALVTTDVVPLAGLLLEEGYLGETYSQENEWKEELIYLDTVDYAGRTMRLVFSWVNNGTGGTQTPAAIDDINISESVVAKPVVSISIQDGSVILNWQEVSLATGYAVYYCNHYPFTDEDWQYLEEVETNQFIEDVVEVLQRYYRVVAFVTVDLNE